MSYSFYLFDTATWTESSPGTFFDTSIGTERLIVDTAGEAGNSLTFNGYDGAQMVTISGNFLGDNPLSGELTAPVTVNGQTWSVESGPMEMDLGFVLQDPATGTYYFVGYVTIGDVPVGSVISQGWNPAEPGVWQDQGPSAGTQLVLTEVTAASPPDNPFMNDTALGPAIARTDLNPFSRDVLISANTTGIIDTASEIVCFCAGTLILTDRGERPVESLAPGDLVLTRDRGLQPVRWRQATALGPAALAKRPGFRPIRLAPGALGPGLPHRALLLSPQHRLLLRSRIVERVAGAPEVLAAAKHLTDVEGIACAAEVTGLTYVHLLFDHHEIIFANGAEAESLFPGPEARKGIGTAGWAEALALLPGAAGLQAAMDPARKLLSGRIARRLAQRHVKNGVPLNAGPLARPLAGPLAGALSGAARQRAGLRARQQVS